MRLVLRRTIIICITLLIFFAVFCSVADYVSPLTAENGLVSSVNNAHFMFTDNFDGETLDSSVWSIINQSEKYNEELQCYDPSCVNVKNGNLIITAKKDSSGKYISGKVDTKGKMELTAGHIDIRMKLCKGKGLFPALWLLYDGGPEDDYMEIDIMESLGQKPQEVYGVLHIKGSRNLKRFYSTNVINPMEYHVYSVSWDREEVEWFIDGNKYYTAKVETTSCPLYLIINLAVGGLWPGSPNNNTKFPASIWVDYVRVHSEKGVII